MCLQIHASTGGWGNLNVTPELLATTGGRYICRSQVDILHSQNGLEKTIWFIPAGKVNSNYYHFSPKLTSTSVFLSNDDYMAAVLVLEGSH